MSISGKYRPSTTALAWLTSLGRCVSVDGEPSQNSSLARGLAPYSYLLPFFQMGKKRDVLNFDFLINESKIPHALLIGRNMLLYFSEQFTVFTYPIVLL